MTRLLALAAISLAFGATAFADDPKPDAADKAIGQAVADLKAKLDGTKDEAERRKLTAAVTQLEALAKKAPQTDNHLLIDFVDNPQKYKKQTLTFKVKLGSSVVGAMNDWAACEVPFRAVVGKDDTEVKFKVHCSEDVLTKSPAAVANGEVVITIAYDENYGRYKLLSAKRP